MTETLNPLPIAVQPGAPDGAHFMPSGNWVVLRDPKTLTRGDKKQLVRENNEGDLTALESGFRAYDLLAKLLVTAWSYPFPLPAADIEAMDRLPLEDEAELDRLFLPAVALIFPSKKVTPDDHADPASPSEPSSD